MLRTNRLEFRIGVNIGDVVQDGDRIYGSGVNVAARIEGIADPGGICVSRNAYDHVKDKLDFGFEYLGEHEVKEHQRTGAGCTRFFWTLIYRSLWWKNNLSCRTNHPLQSCRLRT